VAVTIEKPATIELYVAATIKTWSAKYETLTTDLFAWTHLRVIDCLETPLAGRICLYKIFTYASRLLWILSRTLAQHYPRNLDANVYPSYVQPKRLTEPKFMLLP